MPHTGTDLPIPACRPFRRNANDRPWYMRGMVPNMWNDFAAAVVGNPDAAHAISII